MISQIRVGYIMYSIRKSLGYSCPLIWWAMLIYWLGTGNLWKPKGWKIDPAVTQETHDDSVENSKP